jgi:3-oxoacyl-[acyl-carrier-protein] synthase-3
MKTSQFLGVGYSVPSKIWKNEDLTTLMDTSDEWIHQRTGIKQRHWVDHDSSIASSDLALEATHQALKNAGVAKEEIDMIIFATLSPDHEFPGTGCFFSSKAGGSRNPCLGYSATVHRVYLWNVNRGSICKDWGGKEGPRGWGRSALKRFG